MHITQFRILSESFLFHDVNVQCLTGKIHETVTKLQNPVSCQTDRVLHMRFFTYLILYSSLLQSSRFVMLRRPMHIVDTLCISADVAGGSIPATPRAISEKLKPIMNL